MKNDKDVRSFIKHGINYVSADFIVKGLEFISIPIFTRLLIPSEYGYLSIYLSLVLILTELLGLNLFAGIKRKYYENNPNFNLMLGSNLIFLYIYTCLAAIVLLFFNKGISGYLNVDQQLFTLALVTACLSVFVEVYLNLLQAERKSRPYSVLTIAKGSTIIFLSLGLIASFGDHKYLARLYSHLGIVLVFCIYAIYKLSKKSNYQLESSELIDTLKFSVPMIPGVLSGYVLSFFDRIIINQLNGPKDAGLYSFAYNVGMVMFVVVLASGKAWQPIFFENYAQKNYQRISLISENYANAIYVSALFFIMFSREILLIMADKTYFDALNIVPIIILSYVFVFLYTLYFQYFTFYKQTILISVNTIIAGMVNVALNYLLIPIYGYKIAAYNTFVSYILLFVLYYLNAKYYLKGEIIPLRNIVPNLCLLSLFIGAYFLLQTSLEENWGFLFIKLLFLFIFILLLFFVKPVKIFAYRLR